VVLAIGAALLVGVLLAGVAMAQTSAHQFEMVRPESAAAVKGNKCLKGAYANVKVRSTPVGNQIMNVTLNNAAKNTEYTVFVLQQPNFPFGYGAVGDVASGLRASGFGACWLVGAIGARGLVAAGSLLPRCTGPMPGFAGPARSGESPTS
jgi:hypothetical protein